MNTKVIMGNYKIALLSIFTLSLLIFPMISLAEITDVTLISPANNYYSNDTTQLFRFNATSSTNATFNCSLYLNGTSYANNATTANITDTNLTSSAISTDGKYEWWITCEDSLNSTNSSKRNITIDTTYPLVSYVSAPTANNAYENVVINISYTETNLDTCKLVWDGTEETFTNHDTSNYWETKYLQQGTPYTFYTFCNDSAGQTNTTNSISIYGKQTSSGGGGSSGVLSSYSSKTVPVTMTLSPSVVDLKIYDENQDLVYTGAFRSGDTISIESGTYNLVMEAEGYQRKSVYMDVTGAETLNYALSSVGLHQTQAGEIPIRPIVVILMIMVAGLYLYKNR